MKTIIVFSPHADDLQIAMGGTVLKLIKENTKVIEVIFCSGHMSNPHLREDIVKSLRKKQARKASKSMKIEETIFLELEDRKLKEEIKKVKKKIINLIQKQAPSTIYIPSLIDKHPDHQIVSEFILDITKNMNMEVLAYDVWGIDDKRYPRKFVDITPYFNRKIKLMKSFIETEWFSIYLLLIPAYFRAIKNGMKIKCKYAERFYKIK